MARVNLRAPPFFGDVWSLVWQRIALMHSVAVKALSSSFQQAGGRTGDLSVNQSQSVQ